MKNICPYVNSNSSGSEFSFFAHCALVFVLVGFDEIIIYILMILTFKITKYVTLGGFKWTVRKYNLDLLKFLL